MGAKSDSNQQNELRVILAKIKAQGDNMSEYQRNLLKWHKNVDKGYAWVVLAALWFIMAAVLGSYRMYSLIFAKVTESGVYSREEASWPVSMILTVENLIGPLVSIICYHLTYHQSMLIGGVLLAAGNGFSGLSRNIYEDILLLGAVQGIGYAFIFMPFMEIINNYFLKYRNLALGFALCGGTLSVFIWSPLMHYILAQYPWRYAYVGIGLVCCVIIVLVPFLRSNPMPKLEPITAINEKNNQKSMPPDSMGSISKMSMRALGFQNSIRRQSTILISRQPSVSPLDRQASVISMNPFASSTGLENKVSRAIVSQQQVKGEKSGLNELECETISLSEMAGSRGDNYKFEASIIWDVLKTPAFHLIWFNEFIYFWLFSIYCLVMVDYAIDRGCTKNEAESMLSFQSIGELVGRLGLTILVDMKISSNKNVVTLVLFILAALLMLVTRVSGFIWMASLTTAMFSFVSLLYILLNGLLVDYLGEQQVKISFGLASCLGSFLLFLRPHAVGFCRDHLGSYDPLMMAQAVLCLVGALLWILEPVITRIFVESEDEQATISKLNGKASQLNTQFETKNSIV